MTCTRHGWASCVASTSTARAQQVSAVQTASGAHDLHVITGLMTSYNYLMTLVEKCWEICWDWLELLVVFSSKAPESRRTIVGSNWKHIGFSFLRGTMGHLCAPCRMFLVVLTEAQNHPVEISVRGWICSVRIRLQQVANLPVNRCDLYYIIRYN